MISRTEQKLLYAVYPYLLLPLIRAGHLKKGDENDPVRVMKIVARKRRFATKNMKMCVNLEFTFSEEADMAWRDGKKEIAVVLLAVALEQCLNTVLRYIIEAQGHKSEHVTDLIRTQNIEPKLTWLFEMYSGRKFPKALLKTSKKIFEIRNMLVHYKAVPGNPDLEIDSHSKIEKEMAVLGRFRVGAFFSRFHDFCWIAIRQCDPATELALVLREKVMPYDKI